MKKIIIDGPFIAHRSFLAPTKFTTSTGLDSTLINIFFKSLNKIARDYPSHKLIITWESHGTVQWRRKLYPKYKPERPFDLQYVGQLLDIKNILYNESIPQFYAPANEADDVIGTLIDKDETLIYTVDKDMFQFVNDSTPVKIVTKNEIFDEAATFEKFGITPSQIPLFLALKGDGSDGIPGIHGVGPKKAINYLSYYPNIDLTPEQFKEVELYHQLTKINTKAPIKPFIPQKINSTISIVEKYELKTFSLAFSERQPTSHQQKLF